LLARGSLNDSDRLAHSVFTLGHHLDKATGDFGGYHNSMLIEQIIFESSADNIATDDEVSNLKISVGVEKPKLILIKGGYVNTTRNEDRLGDGSDGLERALNTVENSLENSCKRCELVGVYDLNLSKWRE